MSTNAQWRDEARVLRGAAKIHAVVDAAASSVERDGIACTSKLEQTLFDDMNGLCRELMAELLSAGAPKEIGCWAHETTWGGAKRRPMCANWRS